MSDSLSFVASWMLGKYHDIQTEGENYPDIPLTAASTSSPTVFRVTLSALGTRVGCRQTLSQGQN